MLIDSSKCAEGCDACVDRLQRRERAESSGRSPKARIETKWDRQVAKWIRTVKVQDNLTGQVSRLPMMCQHCEHPPCVDVCPTGASFKRADGIVMVDRHTCIGCRYCMMACPYKARSFIHEVVEVKLTRAPRGKGCVESCNLCVHRRDNGESSTACADACAAEGHNAIVFGDLKDPQEPPEQGPRGPSEPSDPRGSGAQYRCSLRGRLTPRRCCHEKNRLSGVATHAPALLGAARHPRGHRRSRRSGLRVHGARGSLGHGHVQPGHLGNAPCVRRVPDRRSVRGSERRVHQQRLRQVSCTSPWRASPA